MDLSWCFPFSFSLVLCGQEINECYIQQEWYQLDPEGDGLILFENFVTFALRWQLVEDFDKQTAAGGGSGCESSTRVRPFPAAFPVHF